MMYQEKRVNAEVKEVIKVIKNTNYLKLLDANVELIEVTGQRTVRSLMTTCTVELDGFTEPTQPCYDLLFINDKNGNEVYKITIFNDIKLAYEKYALILEELNNQKLKYKEKAVK